MHYPTPPHPPPQRPPPARPPPPGFEGGQTGIIHAGATHKTTSFNNLALALGTNLAECMDDSFTPAGIATVTNTNHIAAAAAAARSQATVSDSDTHLARQSRHSVSRIISAKNNGSVIGSPSSSSQSQQQQQQQLLGGKALLGSGYLMTQQQYNNYLSEKQAQQAVAQKQAQQLSRGAFLNNNNRNNFDNNAINQQHQQSDQQQHDVQQQQQRLMMMGTAWENNTNSKFCISPNDSADGSNLHHHSDAIKKKYTTHNTIGLTVVEPTMTPPLGVGSDGLLYPLLQHQLQQMQQQHDVVVGNATNNNGGRASAPPISRTSAAAAAGSAAAAIGSGGGNILYPNINNRLMAYATNSLQMRVAELHEEFKQGDHSATNISHHSHQLISTPTPNTCTSAQSTISSVGSALLVPPLPGNITIVSSSSASTGGAGGAVGGVNIQITHGLPSSSSSSSSSIIINNPERKRMELLSARELVPFLREPKGEEQRGLVILYGSMLYNILSDVRMTCEAFGTLESFRSDFGDNRGTFFLTYYDLRSARLAVVELPRLLNDMVLMSSSFNGGGGVQVKYCIPLNSSSATADGTILLSDLPGTIDEQDLNQVLSSFGEVRDIHYQANISNEDEDGIELTSYLVEFYDIQDANQAILELEHTHPWGEGVKIKVGTRSPAKKKLGKELLLLMSNWRKSLISDGASVQLPTPQMIVANAQNLEESSNPTAASTEVNYQQRQLPPQAHDQMRTAQSQSYYQYANVQSTVGLPPPHQQYQLVMGADGQYRYVMSSGPTQHYSHSQIIGHPYGHVHSQPQQIMYAPALLEQQYMHSQSQLISPISPPQQYQVHYDLAAHQPVIDYQRQLSLSTQFTHMPSVVTTNVNNDSLSSTSLSGRGVVKPRGSPPTGKRPMTGSNVKDDDGTNSTLMLDDIRTGKDHRSSLMVRNIPNKYTQQMLLSDFAATGHGPDKMDFFYLPIDFKNRCNRGYAFVNFVNYKDIIHFFGQYSDCKWNRFNSDKICCITYARIQGKSAMIKRFEHSSLMEKDDEYRPMVFVSNGQRKGQIESIKDAASRNV